MYCQEICSKVKIIRLPHEKEIAYYTGTHYKILCSSDDLVEMVKERVSPSAFNSKSLAEFPPLFKFLTTEATLDVKNYEERERKSRYLVTMRNGIYDCEKGCLIPFSSKKLTFYQLNANYVENPRLDYFSQILDTWSGGDESIERLLIEVLGYLFSGINEGKKFFVFGTARDSGKSKLLEFIEAIIGEEFVDYMEPENFAQKFGMGEIGNKILCICPDIEDGALKPAAASKLKQISGGDKLSTEQKYVKRKKTHTNARILLVTNSPIRIASKNDDPAFRRRMIVVPFLNSIDENSDVEINLNLLDDLLEERDEIVSYCLQSVSSLIRRNYVFSECQTSEDLKNQWRYNLYDATNSLQAFTDKYIEITDNVEDEVYLQDLNLLYDNFCREEGYTKVSSYSVKKWYTDKGCRHKRIHHSNSENARSGLVGLKFKDQPPSDI